MVLHFTDKLRKKLHIPELTQMEVVTGNHLRWYAHVFTARRVQYILTTNATSLFSVVFHGRGVTDTADYIPAFHADLRGHLAELGLRMIYERVIARKADDIILAKTFDRSVLGSMNDMVNLSKHLLDLEERSPWDLAKALNETPSKSIGYRYPWQVFAQMPLE